jgi:glycolate oxidase
VFLGSEGTLGITTKVTVRLLRTPESVRTLLADFPSIRAAGDVVSDIVSAGIVPAAVEMMDTLAIEAAEEAVHAGYTVGVPAALIVELDGPTAECDTQFDQVKEICDRHGCTRLHIAGSVDERAAIWRGRKAAFAAVGRISPDYFVQDGVVPRTRLAEVLGRIKDMGDEAGLRVANVFHAGDGNLHPLVLYSAAAGETERAEHLSGAIAELCVELGGSLSGEHGIGTDKACSMPKMFGADDLATMARVRDAFDPDGLCNPGKVLPTPRLCGERPGRYRAHPLEEAGVIERL